MKVCRKCNVEKIESDFPKHSSYKDNLDTRCRNCITKTRKIRDKIAKTAPKRPEFCECCKEVPRKWCMDHDHSNDLFRGWLCDRCNTGIGKLGDDISGVYGALVYLINKTIV